MPNPIKYSTGTESDALRKGNFHIGTGSVGKGPSDVTGYYQAVSPVSGGYVIYLNKEGAPGGLSYHSAANDSELITFTNNLAGQSYTTVQQCFNYYYGQTDKVLVNQDYPADYPYIVMDGLVLNLDAGITQSYSGSGTVWTDVNGLGPNNNSELINGTTFSDDNGGCFIFDNTDDFAQSPASESFAFGTGDFTLECWIYPQSYQTYTHMLAFPDQGILALKANIGDGLIYLYTPSWGTYGSTPNWKLQLNTWQHVLFKRESSTGICYYNGNEVGSKNGFTNNFISRILNIHNGYNNREMNLCKIAITRVYKKALSDEEVLQNYNAQKGRFGL